MSKKQYSREQLIQIYRKYAELKGWSTRRDVIDSKVDAWLDKRLGAVGLAIDWYETGRDGAKHLGRNAETISIRKSFGCLLWGFVALIMMLAIVVVLIFVLILVAAIA